jgi:hypothetical protein
MPKSAKEAYAAIAAGVEFLSGAHAVGDRELQERQTAEWKQHRAHQEQAKEELRHQHLADPELGEHLTNLEELVACLGTCEPFISEVRAVQDGEKYRARYSWMFSSLYRGGDAKEERCETRLEAFRPVLVAALIAGEMTAATGRAVIEVDGRKRFGDAPPPVIPGWETCGEPERDPHFGVMHFTMKRGCLPRRE